MTGDASGLPWTDEQWGTVQRTVQEAAAKARVAASFLPLVGPLADGQASVPLLQMAVPVLPLGQRGEAGQRMDIDDGITVPLTTIACNVYLRTQQAEDPELASARQMLGRAAVLIGRLEDAIVFNGLSAPGVVAAGAPRPAVYSIQGGPQQGVLSCPPPAVQVVGPGFGNDLVRAVMAAIQTLEGNGHFGPFACALGQSLYGWAYDPNPGALVLPSDRIIPFLGGPLVRSSALPEKQGVVVALAGSPIDLVVGRDVHVTYLQLSVEPRHILRVSERFVLRLKQPDAACRLFM